MLYQAICKRSIIAIVDSSYRGVIFINLNTFSKFTGVFVSVSIFVFVSVVIGIHPRVLRRGFHFARQVKPTTVLAIGRLLEIDVDCRSAKFLNRCQGRSSLLIQRSKVVFLKLY